MQTSNIEPEVDTVSHVSPSNTAATVSNQGLTTSLVLNIIPFTSPIKEKEFSLYLKKKDGFCPIHKGDLFGVIESLVDEDDLYEGEWLYSDFDTPKQDAITVKVDLTKSVYFAQHYFRHLIRTYFKGKAHVMRQNFTNEIELWFHNPEIKDQKFKVYNQFTLKIQHARVTDNFELVVSYDGTSKVYSKSIAEMDNFDHSQINWVNCDGELYQYKNIPEHHKINLHKLFPVLSNTLKPQLGIAFDIPEFKNRYPKYRSILNDFYKSHLDNDAFRSVIPISPDGFFKADPSTVKRINNSSNDLLFGTALGKQPKTDMRKLGPYKRIPLPNNVRFFFIYQENQRTTVAKLYDYFLKGMWEQGAKYPAFPKMQDFIHQAFFIEDNASIKFKSLDDAVSTVHKAIKNKEMKPDTRYMAIYVSPVSRFNATTQNRHVYYRIKEIVLQHGISSKVVYTNNISLDSFKYFLPNIEIAILAKLGGIPWRLNRSTSNELIVGVGAFYSVSKKTKYVGSAFCFNNEGIFRGFDCFQSNETELLAGSIRKAVMKYIVEHEKADRLIIHFYKQISKKELKPITDMLRKLQLDIPVIVVTINKTESKELLGFDIENPNLMPYSGTYVKTGRNEYLLFNNTRYEPASQPTKKEYHFPVKIHFSSNRPELLANVSTIEELIDQVYQFSRMYWKSVSQQSLPVTIKYPEMVAEIFPWFQYDTLPEFGKSNLWFL